MGFYSAPDSTAKTLYLVIKDMLCRLCIPLNKVQGFAFDDASNMSGKNRGVQALLKDDCPKALYVHCTNHSLDLVLQETARSVKLVAETLQFVKDCSNLIRESSKRRSLFASMFADEDNVITLQALCPTRWCV